MRLFIRQGEQLVTEDAPFRPFLLAEDGDLMEGFKRPFEHGWEERVAELAVL